MCCQKVAAAEGPAAAILVSDFVHKIGHNRLKRILDTLVQFVNTHYVAAMDESCETDRNPAMQPRGNYNKRCQIIEAATAVFCRDGFIGASIDAVAAQAGVSRQTIYNQMGDKEK